VLTFFGRLDESCAGVKGGDVGDSLRNNLLELLALTNLSKLRT
jgi:hypothetical protein